MSQVILEILAMIIKHIESQINSLLLSGLETHC